MCGPHVQFSSPVGTRSVDTPSTPDPHDMYVFEVRGVITCCIVSNTNKTEHLLQGVAPAPRNFSLPAPGAVRVSRTLLRRCRPARPGPRGGGLHARSVWPPDRGPPPRGRGTAPRVACPSATERRF